MDKAQLLTIKEFSQAAGISQQAVYKQLNNKLQTYVVMVENKKMLKKSALQEVYNITSIKLDEQKVDKKLNNQFNQQIIDMLQKELDEKNKQIAEMQKLLDQEQQLRMVEHKKVLELEDMSQQEQIKKHWWNKFI